MPIRTTQQRIDASLPELRQLNILGDNIPYKVVENGEFSVVLLVDEPEPLTVKLPHPHQDEYCFPRVTFEALVVGALEEEGVRPPLEIPEFVDCRPEWPQHMIFTQVGGTTLQNETVRQFSSAEKRALGEKIGAFVAWLAGAMSLKAYSQIRGTILPPFKIPERTNNMRHHARRAWIDDTMPETLADVLVEVDEECNELDKNGMLEPSIVGHDDLRVDNMTFVQRDGVWLPKGVFDFGITKPSSPERELRHMLPLGEDVAEGAIKAYEAASGRKISRPLLTFWALGQAASACAAFIGRDQARLEERLNDLKYLLPDRDWSALTP